jgi:hypothetical protein
VSRRPVKKVRTAVTYERPWDAGMSDLFDLVGAGWTPPATVKVRRTIRSMTVTALFRSPEGLPFRAHARARLQSDGEWIQTQESLGITFSMTGTAR